MKYQYGDIKRAAKAAGVKYSTVWNRMRRKGMTIEEAIAYKRPPTIKEAAQAAGIAYKTVYNRVQRGLSITDAVALPVRVYRRG